MPSDTYSDVVTVTSEALARRMMFVGRVTQDGLTPEQQVDRDWADDQVRERWVAIALEVGQVPLIRDRVTLARALAGAIGAIPVSGRMCLEIADRLLASGVLALANVVKGETDG